MIRFRLPNAAANPPAVVIFTMCYWPEPTGIGPMATDLAEWLADLGWKVTVVTGFPLMPDWEIYPECRGKLFERRIRNKTEIFRSWVYCPRRPRAGRMKTWKRLVFDSTLVFTAVATLLSRRPPDVIVAIGPPLQTGFASLFLKRLWGCPALYWMQDIVPDAAVNVGMMKDGAALRLARRMERAVYEGVDRIGVISDGFRNNLSAKNIAPQKLALLPNWADAETFDATPADAGTRSSLGWDPADFVVMHAGSMGAKQRLENVVGAFRQLEAVDRLRLVFLGGGNCSDAIRSEARRLDVKRVVFLPTAAQADYINLLRAADLLLINQAGTVIDALIPSKLLTYLLAGKPVVAAVNAESETAKFIRRAGCGLIAEPDRPGALAAAILRLENDPAARMRLGAAGAAFVRAHCDKTVLLDRFAAVLTRMASRAGRVPARGVEVAHARHR